MMVGAALTRLQPCHFCAVFGNQNGRWSFRMFDDEERFELLGERDSLVDAAGIEVTQPAFRYKIGKSVV